MWAENDVSDDVSSATDSGDILKKKRAAGKRHTGDGDTTTSSENEEGRPLKRPPQKALSFRDRRGKRKRDPEDMEASDDVNDAEGNVNRRKKQKTNDGCSEHEDGHRLKCVPSTSKRSSARSGGRRKLSEPDSHLETGSSPSDSNSEGESNAARFLSDSRKSIQSSQPKRRARARSPSPAASLDDKIPGSAYVYRAVRQERVALGWSEAPCGSCPVFDFCKEGGPVGPSGCEYYGEWLKRAAFAMDS